MRISPFPFRARRLCDDGAAGSGLGSSIADWRARSIRACADNGWLTLAGLFVMKPRPTPSARTRETTSVFLAGWVPRAGTITVAALGDLAMPGLTPQGGSWTSTIVTLAPIPRQATLGLTMARLAMHVIEREAATCCPAAERSRCARLPQTRLYRPDAAYSREPNTFH